MGAALRLLLTQSGHAFIPLTQVGIKCYPFMTGKRESGNRPMALEPVTAEILQGFQFFPHPKDPTLGILRLDTENEKHWILVTRQILLMLSDSLKKNADEMQGLH